MLEPEERYILHLLRNSLGVEDTWDEQVQFDEQTVLSYIRRNDIFETVYYQLPANLQKLYRSKYFAGLSHSANLQYEGCRILDTLSQYNLDCIALKGWALRRLYPKEQMRHMADLDILVYPYQFDKIKEAMISLGYTSTGQSSWKHDNFIKGYITVEMHKRLTDDSDVIQDWERDLWKRVINTDQPHVYRMSPEDFYIFHFIHLHKDFLNGSLGLRRIADTWLLRNECNINKVFVNKKLEQFGMSRFYQRMIALSDATFGAKEINADDEILLRHAFTHGIYGTDISYKTGRIARMSSHSFLLGKIRSVLAAIFLPYHRMKAQFPILQKKPFLLPLYWIKRIWSLSHRGIKIKERLNYKDISVKDYEEAKTFFKAGGVL